jgi:uncharacterized protein DUF2505
MTTKFSIEHDFPTISLEKFVTYLNDPKLNKLLEKELDFDERKMIEKKEDANGDIEWSFIVKKTGEMPSALKKLIQGDCFSWKEISRYVPKEHCIYWEILPDVNLVKFHGEGVWRLKKLGKGCKRIIEGEIKVDIPLLGKVVESFIVNELKSTYEIEPSVQEKFYASIA